MALSNGDSTIVIPAISQVEHYTPKVAEHLLKIGNAAKNDINRMNQRGNGALVNGNLTVSGVFLRDSSVINVTREAAGGTLGNAGYCARRAARTNDNGNGTPNGSFVITAENGPSGAVASSETSTVGWSINY